MAPRPALERLKRRPRPEDWLPDDLISFAEAVALYFPAGPLTANGLREAYRRGELAGVEICGRTFTTPLHVVDLKTPRLRATAPAELNLDADRGRSSGVDSALPENVRRRIAEMRRHRKG